jgi:hypothetical protein
MASGSATDANVIVTLRFKVEEGVKSRETEYPRERRLGLCCDVLQHRQRQILPRIAVLNRFENSEQGSGTAELIGDHLIDEGLFPGIETLL